MLYQTCLTQKRATNEVERARSLDIPISKLSVRSPRRKIRRDEDAGQESTTDVEGSASATPRDGGWFSMNKVAECRKQSQSAWLHFPHIELIFLLFAFEGAVAAQLAAVRESTSPVVFFLAMAYLVSLYFEEVAPSRVLVHENKFSARNQKHPRESLVTCRCRDLISERFFAKILTPPVRNGRVGLPHEPREFLCGPPRSKHDVGLKYRAPVYVSFASTFSGYIFLLSSISLVCIFIQVLYPVLMIVMVSRTLFTKVGPEDNIAFMKRDEDGGINPSTHGAGGGSSTHSFTAEVKTSLREKHSMFAWANKGEWESVETSDTEVKQEQDWFRIGFEPLFADYTKKGSWFMVYMLLEVSRLLICWAFLVYNSCC